MSAPGTARIRIPGLEKYVERIQRSPLASRLLHGTLWSMVGVLVSRTVGLAASVIIARILKKQDFGALGIIQSTLAMFQAFAGFGLGLTATKHVAEFRSKDPERTGRIIALSGSVGFLTGVIVCACLYFGSDWLAAHSLAAPRLAPLLRLASFALLLTAVNSAQMGTLVGFEDFKAVAKLNLIIGLTSISLSVIGVLWMGLRGAVVATLLTVCVSCLASHAKVRANVRRHAIKVRWHHALGELPVLWHFSIPAVLAGIMVTPVNWLANSWLVQRSDGYSEMAVYSAASQWRTALMFLPMLLMQASLPVLSSTAGEGGTFDFKKTLNMSQLITVGISFPIATFLMLTSVPVLQMYGKDFRSGQMVLVGVVLTALIQCIGMSAGNVLESKGRMWTALVINASWATMYLGFVHLTVGKYGANSLAYSSAAAYLLLTIGACIYIRHYLPSGMLKRIFLALAFAIVVTIACLLTPVRTRLFVAIPVTVLSAYLSLGYFSERRLLRMLMEEPSANTPPVPAAESVTAPHTEPWSTGP